MQNWIHAVLDHAWPHIDDFKSVVILNFIMLCRSNAVQERCKGIRIVFWNVLCGVTEWSLLRVWKQINCSLIWNSHFIMPGKTLQSAFQINSISRLQITRSYSVTLSQSESNEWSGLGFRFGLESCSLLCAKPPFSESMYLWDTTMSWDVSVVVTLFMFLLWKSTIWSTSICVKKRFRKSNLNSLCPLRRVDAWHSFYPKGDCNNTIFNFSEWSNLNSARPDTVFSKCFCNQNCLLQTG